MRKVLLKAIIFLSLSFFYLPSFSQEEKEKKESSKEENLVTIRGMVQEIAADESFIKVEGKKILTPPGFIQDSYIEEKDIVEIIAQVSPHGLIAQDYDYIYIEPPLEESEKKEGKKISSENKD